MRRALRGVVRLIDATHLGLGPRMRRWFGLHDGHVAAKLHVVFDPSAQKPVFFAVTPARINDITAAKQMLPIEPGATYVFDLGYYDFAWWAKLLDAGCNFVTRLKSNTVLRDIETHPVMPGSCVLSDQTGHLPKRLSSTRRNPFTEKGREITIRIDTGKVLRLFTNDLTSPAEEIAELYKERWQIELFFQMDQAEPQDHTLSRLQRQCHSQPDRRRLHRLSAGSADPTGPTHAPPSQLGLADRAHSSVRAPSDRSPARPQQRQAARTNHLLDPTPLPAMQLTCRTAVGLSRPPVALPSPPMTMKTDESPVSATWY